MLQITSSSDLTTPTQARTPPKVGWSIWVTYKCYVLSLPSKNPKPWSLTLHGRLSRYCS